MPELVNRRTIALLFFVACTRDAHVAKPAAPPPRSTAELRFDVGAIDRNVDPCNDFYDYACGGWRASHPIPPDRTSWNRYAEANALNQKRERAIIEEASAHASTPSEKRLGAYFRACTNEGAIEARALEPLHDLFTKIAAMRTKTDVSEMLAELQAHEVDALLDPMPSTDPNDSTRIILAIGRGTLGLPDRDDYLKPDDTRRKRYEAHLARLFRLLGDGERSNAAAARVVALETALAKNALSAVEARHRETQIHPMTIAELSARWTAIDWPAWLRKLGPSVARVNVSQPAWVDAVDRSLSDLDAVRDEMRALVVRRFATMLPSAIEAETFDFHEGFLRGAHEKAPRWRQCLDLVDRDIGEDVGRTFLARHFDDAAKARVKAMVDRIIAAYRDDLASADWLGPAARGVARAKLDDILVVIGASNRMRSLEGLKLDDADAFGNAWRGEARFIADAYATIGPTDRESFFDTLPQLSDAFGSKSLNAVGLTAGFLQPPVFDPAMDDAVNFGGLGSVIGHELSHRFDDEGRKYDASGNLRSWWSDEDVANFEKRAQCFVDEYSRFRLDDGTPVDGKLTLGENIADNGGIRLSWAALHPTNGPSIDGLTPAQRFFVAWGQIRCENVTPEKAHLLVKTDPHSPGRFRVNGVVSNLPDFARAFSCRAGAPMAPANRCALW
jgi:endothelin-converting enzyme/putative endopeptidase